MFPVSEEMRTLSIGCLWCIHYIRWRTCIRISVNFSRIAGIIAIAIAMVIRINRIIASNTMRIIHVNGMIAVAVAVAIAIERCHSGCRCRFMIGVILSDGFSVILIEATLRLMLTTAIWIPCTAQCFAQSP